MRKVLSTLRRDLNIEIWKVIHPDFNMLHRSFKLYWKIGQTRGQTAGASKESQEYPCVKSLQVGVKKRGSDPYHARNLDDVSSRNIINEAGVMESDALRCNALLRKGRQSDASEQERTEMEEIVVIFLEE